MIRPCFLVVDHEYPGSISTRKLVIETAKFNVITAYSSQEALATFERFPKVHGIVLNAEMDGMSCEQLVQSLRALSANVPIVVTSLRQQRHCGPDEYHVDSYDPEQLLTLLKKLNPSEA